jgi:hypothetical protein
VESDQIGNAGQLSEEYAIFGVELDARSVSFVGQRFCHGSTPAISKNSRKART